LPTSNRPYPSPASALRLKPSKEGIPATNRVEIPQIPPWQSDHSVEAFFFSSKHPSSVLRMVSTPSISQPKIFFSSFSRDPFPSKLQVSGGPLNCLILRLLEFSGADFSQSLSWRGAVHTQAIPVLFFSRGFFLPFFFLS